MFDDLPIVALTRDLPEQGLSIGDIGTIVHVYENGKAYEVEFSPRAGQSLTLVTLEPNALRPVGSRDVANAGAVR